MAPASLAAPPMANTMGGGGPVTQAWINEAKGAMGGKLEPQQTTAPTANTMVSR